MQCRQDLSLVPSIVPEAILGTKEVNEKTRGLAYRSVADIRCNGWRLF
jgi:hypothetical protein